MAFAQRVRRLRFYSQCADQSSSIVGLWSGSSPSSSVLTTQKIKRSTSCPDVYRKTLEDVAFSDSIDAVCNPTNQMDLSEKVSTLKGDTVHPYELLFEGALPSFLQYAGEISAQIQSPHHLLDLCIRKAAALHGMNSKAEEINLLRGQVELLHAQLLFERHRREAHALRNRSLAKRCRSILQQDEKNYALANQLTAFEKEITMLKKELINQRASINAKEKEFQQLISTLELKVGELTNEIRLLREHKLHDDTMYSKLSDEFQTLQKEIDQRKAEIFRLENEIRDCKKYVALNGELKGAYEMSQKEILLLGELYRRQQEILTKHDSNQYVLHEMEDLRLTCESEVASE